MKRLTRIAGILLRVAGLAPLTPLVFLLALIHGNPGGVFSRIHLQFWQTQAIGAVVAALGALLFYRADSRASKAARDSQLALKPIGRP